MKTEQTMRVAVFESYKKGADAHKSIHLDTRAVPEPRANELLVRVHMTSLNAADGLLLQGSPWVIRMSQGVFRPRKENRVLGSDLVGKVVACGSPEDRHLIGSMVMADVSDSGRGSLAEYIRIPRSTSIVISDEISLESAAALPLAGSTALQALRNKLAISTGERILILGASGGVGHLAVQLARNIGCIVCAVCSEKNIELAKKSGAAEVFDYRKINIIEQSELLGSFNSVLDVASSYTMAEIEPLLADGGKYVRIGGSLKRLFGVMFGGKRFGKKTKKSFGTYLQKVDLSDLETLVELLVGGHLTPHIDAVYPLENVQEAFRYFIEEHPQGKVLISCL